MASYINDFLLAHAATRNIGLPVEPFALSDSPQQLTQEDGVELMKLLEHEFAAVELNVADIALRCAQVSRMMRSHVGNVTGHTALLTVGSVSFQGAPLVEVGSGLLEDMADSGAYHVWLTMPWAEIIDFTLQLSLAVLKGLPLDRVSPLAGYPEALNPFSWKPLYVGTAAVDFLLAYGQGI